MVTKQPQDQSQDEILKNKEYLELKEKLARELLAVQKTGTRALNEQKLGAYWSVGKMLAKTSLPSEKMIPALTRDLGQDKMFFYRARQFFNLFPKRVPTAIKQTNWTLVTEVLPLADIKQAQFYLTLARDQGLGRDNLRKAIRKNYFALGMTEAKLKTTLKLTLDTRFCYKVKLIKVIDGDTIVVELDLGFDVKITATLRLRGLNCAEMSKFPSPLVGEGGRRPGEGALARQHVQRVLDAATQILARTHKTDIYGRYLADIFYTPVGETEPVYLNQELLDGKLARPME